LAKKKTSKKINNIIGNSIKNHNKFEKRGVYKLICNSCNKFYTGRTKINFRTRFNEHRRNFATCTGESTFSEHILNMGHEMRPMEETMKILHFENDPRRINAPEELEIMKATTSYCMLNIVHNFNPFYRIPHLVQNETTPYSDTADDAA
jgi:GIY-YIG catalytic domain.